MPGIWLAASIASRSAASRRRTTFYVFERALLGEYKPPVDGSLSYDFFKDRVLEIDYPHHRIRFSNPIATPVPAAKPDGAGALRLITFGERGPPVVVGSPFTVNGKTVHAQIDTVFTGTMLIYDSALATLGLTKEGAAELFQYTDGGVNLLAGRSDSVGFGRRGLSAARARSITSARARIPCTSPTGCSRQRLATRCSRTRRHARFPRDDARRANGRLTPNHRRRRRIAR